MARPAAAGASAVVAVLGAAGLLLVLVTWAASIGPDGVVSARHAQPTAASARPSPTTPVAHGRTGLDEVDRGGGRSAPDWMTAIALVLVVLPVVGLLVVAAWLAVRLRSRRSSRGRRPGHAAPEVQSDDCDAATRVSRAMSEEVEEQRAVLTQHGEPRNAIVECWCCFERQAHRAGVERRTWQTTAEYVSGVLDQVGADSGAVAGLAELYREARYSDHDITEAHRQQALEDLDTIHRSLRTGVLR